MTSNIKEYVLACALAGDIAPLAYQLEFTDNPLSEKERKFLADHLRGIIQSPANRKKLSPRVIWEARDIIDIVLCEELAGGTRTYAIEAAAKACGLSESTVRNRLTLLAQGEEQERRESLKSFHKMCDDLNQHEAGRGDIIRKNEINNIMSGARYKAERLSAK